MDIVKLQGFKRPGSGKKYTIKARMRGRIPAVYYGRNMNNENIEIDAREFAALARARKTTHLIDLQLEGAAESIAVIKEVQRDVLRDGVYLHVDFQHVNMNEKIVVEVPVEVAGLPIGVKEEGGVLGHPHKRIAVECLPMDIPEKIVLDVSELHIGESIHVKDVKVDKAVIKESPDVVLAVVTHPTKEEAPVVAAAVEGVEGAVPVEGAAPAEGAAAPAVDGKDAAGKDAKPGAAKDGKAPAPGRDAAGKDAKAGPAKDAKAAPAGKESRKPGGDKK